MIRKVIYFGVPNTPGLLRDHLAHYGIRVSKKRAERLSVLYKHLVKEPAKFTSAFNDCLNPFESDIEKYANLKTQTARSDIRVLMRAGLVFAFKSEPTLKDMFEHVAFRTIRQ